MDTNSVEKLDKLLKEGKISSQEYFELRDNLPKTPTNNSSLENKPWQVLACAWLLFIVSLMAVIIVGIQKPKLIPVAFVASILNTAFGFGLLYRKKWAFVLSLIFAILSGVFSIFTLNIVGAFINIAFFIVLYGVRDWFHVKVPWDNNPASLS